MKEAIDTYEAFFSEITSMTPREIAKHCLSLCKFLPKIEVKEDWENIRKSFRRGGEHYVRLNTNEGKIKLMYRDCLDITVRKDPDGNQEPNKILSGNPKGPATYVCAHIFGRTKNPLLFTAKFNLCYIPEFFASWTDDRKGQTSSYRDEFRKEFYSKVFKDYGEIISEYNDCKIRKQVLRKLEDEIKKRKAENQHKSKNRDQLRWLTSIIKQWKPLPESYKELRQNERK